MKSFRSVLFWMHLACGIAAGVVILIMCVTGVALTYEKQMLEWADRRAWTAPSRLAPGRLSPETLLAQVAAARPGAAPIGSRCAPMPPRLPPSPSKATRACSSIRTPAHHRRAAGGAALVLPHHDDWHRYLALEGTSRATGKAITGAANLVFLFIVLSGMYLWLPRVWTWIQFKNVLWFRGGLAPKARDFNWHNVIGIWSAVPLAIVVAGAVPISYPWASNLVYRMVGETPPAPSRRRQRRGPRNVVERCRTPRAGDVRDLTWPRRVVDARRSGSSGVAHDDDALATSAKAPHSSLTVDEGYGGQPQKRTTLTFDRASGAVAEGRDLREPERRAPRCVRGCASRTPAKSTA